MEKKNKDTEDTLEKFKRESGNTKNNHSIDCAAIPEGKTETINEPESSQGLFV